MREETYRDWKNSTARRALAWYIDNLGLIPSSSMDPEPAKSTF